MVALDPEQTANAQTIAAVGRRLGIPDRGLVVALATAMQESTLHNVPYGDRDSVGLFPSASRSDVSVGKDVHEGRLGPG